MGGAGKEAFKHLLMFSWRDARPLILKRDLQLRCGTFCLITLTMLVRAAERGLSK
jgi:hypothetical protein